MSPSRIPHNTFLNLHFPHPRLRRRGKLILATCLAATAYLLGFAVYVMTLPTPFATLPSGLEGLATFTGGSGRVEAALKELQRGFNGPILISGSHRETRLTDILAKTDANLTTDQQSHIVYDAAQTTRENVTSLAAWTGYYNLKNVGLITSTYHVPRVRLLALLHTPQSLNLVYLPVQPADAGLRPLFKEYNKLLIAPLIR